MDKKYANDRWYNVLVLERLGWESCIDNSKDWRTEKETLLFPHT